MAQTFQQLIGWKSSLEPSLWLHYSLLSSESGPPKRFIPALRDIHRILKVDISFHQCQSLLRKTISSPFTDVPSLYCHRESTVDIAPARQPLTVSSMVAWPIKHLSRVSSLPFGVTHHLYVSVTHHLYVSVTHHLYVSVTHHLYVSVTHHLYVSVTHHLYVSVTHNLYVSVLLMDWDTHLNGFCTSLV